MEYIYIGKIVSTHGIKGELKIKSDFDYKSKVFVINKKLYLGPSKTEKTIKSYRVHKNYDMVTFDGYNNINQVLELLKTSVYAAKEDLELDKMEILDDDLIDLEVFYKDELIGKITEVFKASSRNKVIRFQKENKTYLVPYNWDFIEDINLENKRLILKTTGGVVECESIY